jgi:hypothetical protein
MSTPPPPQEEPPESESDRRRGNIALLVIFALIVAIGLWLAQAMVEQRAIDDCAAQGRRNCAPLDVPAR